MVDLVVSPWGVGWLTVGVILSCWFARGLFVELDFSPTSHPSETMPWRMALLWTCEFLLLAIVVAVVAAAWPLVRRGLRAESLACPPVRSTRCLERLRLSGGEKGGVRS